MIVLFRPVDLSGNIAHMDYELQFLHLVPIAKSSRQQLPRGANL